MRANRNLFGAQPHGGRFEGQRLRSHFAREVTAQAFRMEPRHPRGGPLQTLLGAHQPADPRGRSEKEHRQGEERAGQPTHC